MLMLCALRRTRLASLLALLIVTGSVPISTSALLHDASDDACQTARVQHDESAHRLGGTRSTSPEAPQHCAICHWLQSLQTIIAAAAIIAPATHSQHVGPFVLVVAGTAGAGQLSARAPPAAL